MNNEVEYEVLPTVARVIEVKTFIVQADSQLVVSQVRGDYEVKEERMQNYLKIVKELL